MAWLHNNYEEQATDAARLATLRAHISEVNARIAASVSDGGASRDTGNLTNYVSTVLDPRRRELEAATRGSRHSFVRRGRH